MQKQRGIWRHFWRTLPTVAVVAFLVHLIQGSEPASSALDSFQLLRAGRIPQEILIVEIGDEDYDLIFEGRSPLDTERLHNLLEALVKARPSVIGIAIDTSAEQFKALEVEPGWPLVWAQEMYYREDPPSYLPIPATGGVRSIQGVSALRKDRDGIVRRYRRTIPSPGGDSRSFALQVCIAHKRDVSKCGPRGEVEEALLDYSIDPRDFSRISATSVLKASKGAAWSSSQSLPAGKVVLVGGTYRSARSEVDTPLGSMSGIYLQALSVHGEIKRINIGIASKVELLLLEVLAAFLLVCIQVKIRSLGVALLLSLIAIPMLSLLASAVAFSTISYWVNVAPVLLAVLMHSIFEHARHYQALYSHYSSRHDPADL